MSNTVSLEKKDLRNIETALQVLEEHVRSQQIGTITAGAQMGVDVSALGEYYSKRLTLIERNKKNIQWLIGRMEEFKEEDPAQSVIVALTVCKLE